MAVSDFAASDLADAEAVDADLAASGFAEGSFAVLGLAVSEFEDPDLEEADLEDSDLEDSDLEASVFEDFGLTAFEASDLFDVSDLEESDLASGVVGVWATAGKVASARPMAKLADNAIDKANGRRIDGAVDRSAAARLGWVTAFLRGESSIPLGTMSI